MDKNLFRFQYASVLSKSRVKEDKLEALLHLEYLVSSSPEFQRDALYLMAVTKYLLEDYDAGRACAEELLRIDPDNHQVCS
jgi:tetratricopeptide (TPR) repeat protein